MWTLIALAGWFVLKQATSKENKQDITIGDNSTVEIIQGEKESWFKPFVELYTDYNSKTEGSLGTKCGVRLEF